MVTPADTTESFSAYSRYLLARLLFIADKHCNVMRIALQLSRNYETYCRGNYGPIRGKGELAPPHMRQWAITAPCMRNRWAKRNREPPSLIQKPCPIPTVSEPTSIHTSSTVLQRLRHGTDMKSESEPSTKVEGSVFTEYYSGTVLRTHAKQYLSRCAGNSLRSPSFRVQVPNRRFLKLWIVTRRSPPPTLSDFAKHYPLNRVQNIAGKNT